VKHKRILYVKKALCIASAMCFNVANLDGFLFKSKKIIKNMTKFEPIAACGRR